MEQAARMSLEKRTPDEGVDEASSNVKTGQLASMIIELGPNISEIARRLGQFKESVRYRYKEKLLSKGFAVRVAVDNEKLGLRRVIILVDFSDAYQEVAQKMMTALSEEGYLASFEKTLPDGKYLVHASVPEECVEDYREFFGDLRQKGYFRTVEFYTFHWFRNPPMKTEMYDFDEGRWDFDWSTEAEVRQVRGAPCTLGQGEVRHGRPSNPKGVAEGREQVPRRDGRDSEDQLQDAHLALPQPHRGRGT